MAGRAAPELRTPDVGADASAGPGRTLPASFQQWCSLASEVLAPAEEIAPFKLGAIKALISDIDRDAGLFVAPAFAVGQVLFLVAFVGYLVTAITALVLDADAATDACARTSWVWLFVLLAAAIPLALGLTVALVKAGLAAGNIKVPAALFSVTGPVCYIVLFVLGVVLWAGMAPECDAVYSRDYFLLHLIFKVQVFVLGIAALLGALTAWGQAVALFAEFETPELPQNFGEFSSLVVTHLAPVEELSPFKLGQIQELMSTVDKDAGDAVAPTFAVAIVFFLLAFVAYFTVAVVALVLDRDALWDSCAKDYWVWLFVLLALAIPTGMGLVMGLVKTALNAANLKKTVGFEIPAVFLALPGPALYIVFGVLGIVIWATMDDECVDWYEGNAMLLLTVFRIQVILFGVAAIIGALTVIAQAAVLISQLASGAQQGGGGEGGRQPDTPAEPPGFQMPEMPKVELPEMPTIEMPKIEMPQMPEVDLGFTFEDFSALVVEKLSPLEQLSPFKVGAIQQLIADGDADLGKKTAPYFAIILVLFLLAFLGYFVTALVALVLDATAMDAECAEETYIWLYVFIVLVLPTIVGVLIGLIERGLKVALQREDEKYLRIARMFLAIPSPLLLVCLGVLGLALWGGMGEECADFYWNEYRLLLVVFYLQIGLTCIGGALSFLTILGMVVGLINRAVGYVHMPGEWKSA